MNEKQTDKLLIISLSMSKLFQKSRFEWWELFKNMTNESRPCLNFFLSP
jgi:hypothetical protein